MSGEPSPTAVPTGVRVAFWLYMAGAALGLVSVAVGAVVGIQAIQSGQIAGRVIPPGADVSPSVLNTALTVAVALGVVVGVISVAAYVVFALLMRRGANWARIVLTVLSAIALVSGIVGLLGLNLLNLLVSALVVAAAVLLYMPASNAWFAARTAARTPRSY